AGHTGFARHRFAESGRLASQVDSSDRHASAAGTCSQGYCPQTHDDEELNPKLGPKDIRTAPGTREERRGPFSCYTKFGPRGLFYWSRIADWLRRPVCFILFLEFASG